MMKNSMLMQAGIEGLKPSIFEKLGYITVPDILQSIAFVGVWFLIFYNAI